MVRAEFCTSVCAEMDKINLEAMTSSLKQKKELRDKSISDAAVVRQKFIEMRTELMIQNATSGGDITALQVLEDAYSRQRIECIEAGERFMKLAREYRSALRRKGSVPIWRIWSLSNWSQTHLREMGDSTKVMLFFLWKWGEGLISLRSKIMLDIIDRSPTFYQG